MSALLRLASYNVHAWIGRDGRADPARAAEVLREIGADVVALQEATHLGRGPIAALCEEAGYEVVEGPTLVRDRSPFGNALLSRVPVEAIERTDLSVLAREARGALAVALRHEGWSCHVVNTHLGLRARERRLQVARLLEWIGAEAGRSGPDVAVLMGDVNEWRPRAGVLRRLDAVFGASGSARTFPAWRPWLRLDRIWVQPPFLLRQGVGAHDTPLARAASDHLPIVAELELSGRGRPAAPPGLTPIGERPRPASGSGARRPPSPDGA